MVEGKSCLIYAAMCFLCPDSGTKTYAHQMVRTDSKEQKLDAFLKPSNQNKAVNQSTNQRPDGGTGANQMSPSASGEKRLTSGESAMEIDNDTVKKQR